MKHNVASIRTRADLLEAIGHGLNPEYLHFWGHRVPRDGSLTRSCLSQWYPARFCIEGVTYPTAEHYMMASKARLFEDREAEAKILAASDPNAAKKLGRRVRNYDDGAWKRRRYEAVVEGNLAKFGQNERLGQFLAATADRILVEASPVDTIWGIGLSAEHPDAANPLKWRGLNLLGFALMETREQLSNQ